MVKYNLGVLTSQFLSLKKNPIRSHCLSLDISIVCYSLSQESSLVCFYFRLNDYVI